MPPHGTQSKTINEPCIVIPLFLEIDRTAFDPASASRQLCVFQPISQMSDVGTDAIGISGFSEIQPFLWWDNAFSGDAVFATVLPDGSLIAGLEFFGTPLSSEFGGPPAPVVASDTHGLFYVTNGLQALPFDGPYMRDAAAVYPAGSEALYGQYLPGANETHILRLDDSGLGAAPFNMTIDRYGPTGKVGSYIVDPVRNDGGGHFNRPAFIDETHLYVCTRPGSSQFKTVSRTNWTAVPDGGSAVLADLFSVDAVVTAQITRPTGSGAWNDFQVNGIYGVRSNGNLIIEIYAATSAGTRGSLQANYLCEITTSGTLVHTWPTVLQWIDASFHNTFDAAIFPTPSPSFDSTYLFHTGGAVDPNNDGIVYKTRFWDRPNDTSTPGRLTVCTAYQVDITTGTATPVGHFDLRYLNRSDIDEYGVGYYFSNAGVTWVPRLSYITSEIQGAAGGPKVYFSRGRA